MRVAFLGLIVVAVLGFSCLGSSWTKSQVNAQQPGFTAYTPKTEAQPTPMAVAGAQEGIIAIQMPGTPTHQLMTLVDARRRVMSVYQIDRNSGEIRLKSVRNVDWDLQLDEFNGTNPSPREIQTLLQHR